MEAPSRRASANADLNKLSPEDRAAHRWFRFVLSYPPHLVRDYVTAFDLPPNARLLDPFCGTGTTIVESKKLGVEAIGVEANHIATFASAVKVDWTPDPDGLLAHAQHVARRAKDALAHDGISDPPIVAGAPSYPANLRVLPKEQAALLLADSISPLPLHKALVLRDCIRSAADDRYLRHELLAFARAVVFSASNLQFGPEVGIGAVTSDAPMVDPWLHGVREMADDLRAIRAGAGVPATVHHADARSMGAILEKASIDAVITSPPYPNEKDYTRTTRLESVLLGYVTDRASLQQLKRTLVRSNTRGVYRNDDDDTWVVGHPDVERVAAEIEARRVDLGKTSGFERMYPRVTRLYFGGMARHLAELRPFLRAGARLAYVVGDQASYLRVMIRTGQILADIAGSLGYEVERIDLFRTRLATATRAQLREEVVVLRWPGGAA